MMRSLRATAMMLIALPVLACSSSSRTQIMLVVDAEQSIRDDTVELRVQVWGRAADERDFAVTEDITYPLPGEVLAFPRRFAIIPTDHDASRFLRVQVTAIDAAGDNLVTRSVVTGFSKGDVRRLDLTLRASCRDAACDETTETCVMRGCESNEKDVSALPTYEPPADASVDAAPADSNVEDTGVTDTGVTDTGVTDTGVTDTGVTDTGVTDTGVTDTGVTDTGVTDTGVTDSGSEDGGPLCNPAQYESATLGTGSDTMGVLMEEGTFYAWRVHVDTAFIATEMGFAAEHLDPDTFQIGLVPILGPADVPSDRFFTGAIVQSSLAVAASATVGDITIPMPVGGPTIMPGWYMAAVKQTTPSTRTTFYGQTPSGTTYRWDSMSGMNSTMSVRRIFIRGCFTP